MTFGSHACELCLDQGRDRLDAAICERQICECGERHGVIEDERERMWCRVCRDACACCRVAVLPGRKYCTECAAELETLSVELPHTGTFLTCPVERQTWRELGGAA